MELLIVVVILGVLAALVIPRFMGQGERAKTEEAITIMTAMRRALLKYYDANQSWPGGLAVSVG